MDQPPFPTLADPSSTATDPGILPSASLCPILVVDDDPVILQSVSEALGLSGYPVTTARNGAEALLAVEEGGPQVVLLDLRMPVMDGWEFVRVVRERQLEPRIVVMTATLDARRQAESLRVDAYLAKPFGVDQLLDVVERICGGT